MLSKFGTKTFTIINQIPKSENDTSKTKWQKHILTHCDVRNGVYDKSTGVFSGRGNLWTVYIYDWQFYKPPIWSKDGYYFLDDLKKEKYFTVNVGDLIIFENIPDKVPTSISEFSELEKKYRQNGGTVSNCEAFIRFKRDGKTPWKTNHIEAVKG